MKKLIQLMLFAMLGCSKEEPELQKTTLEITVLDNHVNFVQDATVYLFDDETAWKNQVPAKSIATTDVLGVARFEDGIEAKKYYWTVIGHCASNYKSSHTTAEPLVANKKNIGNCQINDEGTFWLQSNSNNPYSIEIDGIYFKTLQGGEIFIDEHWPTGTYSVKVIQQSGYILSPTIKTYIIPIGKCQQNGVEFPF